MRSRSRAKTSKQPRQLGSEGAAGAGPARGPTRRKEGAERSQGQAKPLWRRLAGRFGRPDATQGWLPRRWPSRPPPPHRLRERRAQRNRAAVCARGDRSRPAPGPAAGRRRRPRRPHGGLTLRGRRRGPGLAGHRSGPADGLRRPAARCPPRTHRPPRTRRRRPHRRAHHLPSTDTTLALHLRQAGMRKTTATPPRAARLRVHLQRVCDARPPAHVARRPLDNLARVFNNARPCGRPPHSLNELHPCRCRRRDPGRPLCRRRRGRKHRDALWLPDLPAPRRGRRYG